MEIKNIALIGHNGSGKTTLADSVMYKVGEVSRQGKVDDGTSLFDYNPEEINRKFSISLSLATFKYKDIKVNLIDLPGFMDFWGEVFSGLSAADSAILVVDAQSGIEVGTEKLWEYAHKKNFPLMIFLNKFGKENTNFETLFNVIKKEFGTGVFPFTFPIGSFNNLKGVVNVFKKKAYIDGKEKDVPDDLTPELEKYHNMLIESVSEVDDALMEKYINEEELTEEEIRAGLKRGIMEGKIFPVLSGDAISGIGVESVLDTIIDVMPSYADKKIKGIKDGKEVDVSLDAPFSGFVFKTIFEPHLGEMNLIKIFSGTLEAGSEVLNVNKNKLEKINQVYLLKGKEKMETEKLEAGEIGALVKLRNTETSNTLADKNFPVSYPEINFPPTSIAFAIVPKSKGDEEKVSSALAKIHQEDPSFSYGYDNETKQTLIYGLGEMHLDVIISTLKRKFSVEVGIERPLVKYRETIKSTAEAQGKYKRQTGGRGQYGDVWLKIEPLKEQEFEFVDKIVGGVVPSKYIPSVEKGVREAMSKGILASYPVMNVRVTIYDGSYHPVDSSDIAFKIAGSMAFKNAAQKANPVILEPVLEVEVTVPEEYMGDVIGDLNSRRGQILGMDRVGRYQRIKAYVPDAEMYKYSTQLRSITQGKGTFTQKFAYYQEMPKEIQEKLIEQRAGEKEER